MENINPISQPTISLVKPVNQHNSEATFQIKLEKARPPKANLEAFQKAVQDFPLSSDRRIELRYSEELKQVLVKIIDTETDKVVRELPTAELQKVHLHIREALGLLLDKEV